MKTLWMMISTIAVANLLAICVFAGWLYSTDRLNLARMQQIRVLLAQTVTTEAVTLASGGQRSLTAAYAWLQFILPLLCFAAAAWVGQMRKFKIL